ncbi:hypothetical protein BEH70_11740 [Citrobacter freundii]|nr:hypothetical protein BEH70_11740 [Citrobacter freundii]
MGAVIKELVQRGHERAAELKASCGAVDVRSLAQLISDLATQLEVQLVRGNALAAENVTLNDKMNKLATWPGIEFYSSAWEFCNLDGNDALEFMCDVQTPATDAFLAEVRAQSHKEGAHFVANRMLAAWEAGFIDDTAKNAADIARMILTSTEFMADAPEGDFDRSFADGVLEDIAAQLRKGVQS